MRESEEFKAKMPTQGEIVLFDGALIDVGFHVLDFFVFAASTGERFEVIEPGGVSQYSRSGHTPDPLHWSIHFLNGYD